MQEIDSVNYSSFLMLKKQMSIGTELDFFW
jgi:hypothetical protein